MSNIDDTPKVISGYRVICEVPPGTVIKGFDGKLIACHPDHNPVIITGECFNQLIVDALEEGQ